MKDRIDQVELCLIQYFESDEWIKPLQDVEVTSTLREQLLQASTSDEQHEKFIECSQDATSFENVIFGISSLSYVRQLAIILVHWHQTQENPLCALPPPIEYVEMNYIATIAIKSYSYNDLDNLMIQIFSDDVTLSYKFTAISTFWKNISGFRGMLTLLGFRETIGSRSKCPLTRKQCLSSFCALNSKKEKLTVGARAYTKHFQRSMNGWWGELCGNDDQKNATALQKVVEILDEAVWKNIHSLAHGCVVMELRTIHGYGARWDVDNVSFRGFLEPQMLDGHDKKWIH